MSAVRSEEATGGTGAPGNRGTNRVVGDLRVLAPDDLAACSDETELGDVHLDDGTLGDDAELGVHGRLRVLLDADDRQLEGRLQFGCERVKKRVNMTYARHGTLDALTVCDVRLLDSERGRADEPLEFGRFPREVLPTARTSVHRFETFRWCEHAPTHLSDKGGLGDHALPALALRLARLDDLEHLVLCDTPDLGQGDGELAGLFLALLLDRRRERFGVVLALAIEEVSGQGTLRESGSVLGLDVALLVGLDGLFHGDLFGVATLVQELGLVAVHRLGHLRLLVDLTGSALALALLVVETTTISLWAIAGSRLAVRVAEAPG